jgi:SAM-dependent methyltransferase
MTEPFADIAGFYTGLIERFGHDPRSCDYGTPGAQATKFRVLAGVTALAGRSVLDVGCGFADWSDWLDREVGAVRYTGIDITAAMIDEARRLHPSLDLRVANVLDGDVEGPFDVVTANGIFYLLGADAPSLMQRIVTKMYDLCSVAVAFNTMSSWAPADPGEFAADPHETVEFCRSLTPWVTLRHDYHHRDFTVYLYRERQQ